MTTAIVTQETQTMPTLTNNNNLNSAMEIATELAKSDIIPKEFQKKPANCLIAVELANRLKASPFQVMQNMDVIYGRPSLRSAFIIACINNSGKIIGSLKFEIDEQETRCRAVAIEKETGAKMCGPIITLEMAKNEGWLTKNGSKWKTMPGLMLRYRAASFFGRLYCPEILNGMYSAEEVIDITPNQTEEATDVFGSEIPELPNNVIANKENTLEPNQTEEMEITPEMEQYANEYFETNEQ